MMQVQSPETPYLLGGIVITGVALKKGNGGAVFRGIAATAALVILASFTAGTEAAPIVKAFGWLLFIVAAITAVNSVTRKGKK